MEDLLLGLPLLTQSRSYYYAHQPVSPKGFPDDAVVREDQLFVEARDRFLCMKCTKANLTAKTERPFPCETWCFALCFFISLEEDTVGHIYTQR